MVLEPEIGVFLLGRFHPPTRMAISSQQERAMNRTTTNPSQENCKSTHSYNEESGIGVFLIGCFPPPTEELEESLNMRDQRTLFDLTQDGLVIGEKIQHIYPEFDVSAFVSDVRTEMEGQTIYNVTKAIGRVLRQYLPENYSEALAILMRFSEIEAPSEPTRHPTAEVETGLRPIAHFISLYGLADFDASLDAFCELSKHRCTRGGEIREFIIKEWR